MTEQANETQKQNLEKLVGEFANPDGLKRQQARLSVTELGTAATPFLIKALKDARSEVRWEAAKTFSSIRDPQAAEALVECLGDEVFEVRWLAAEALIVLAKASILPLLQALVRDSGSRALREGSHHILHDLERKQVLEPPVLEVLEALRSLDADFDVISAATKAITFENAKKNKKGLA